MERIISRTDLLSPHTSGPSSPNLAQIAQIQEFNFIHHEELPDAQIPDENDEHEFSFQLFAGGPTATSRIRLDSPDRANLEAEAGMLQPDRPSKYYFTGPPNAQQRQNFEAAAISGEDLLSWSTRTTRSPGMSHSWKVTHVPATTKRQRRLLRSFEDVYAKLRAPVVTKRARPGKKVRIAGRIKIAATKVEEEAERRVAEAKDVREREKRVRRNREKKLKKKGKAKAKKAETVSGSMMNVMVAAGDEKSEVEDGG